MDITLLMRAQLLLYVYKLYKYFNNMYVLVYHYMVAPMLATCYVS